MTVKWRDLTQADRDQLKEDGILNGCGPEGYKKINTLLRRILPSTYQEWCDHHDYNYYLGGSEADRIKADWQFYEALRAVAARQPWWSRPVYCLLAWLAYTVVRRNGAEFFNYK